MLNAPGRATERLGIFLEQSSKTSTPSAQVLEILWDLKRQTDSVPDPLHAETQGLLPVVRDIWAP